MLQIFFSGMRNIAVKKMKRQIIKIDEEKCTGCGDCIPECHEGALQLIDGKARLISDLMCDGLGACLGHCPEGAITLEEREAEPYNELMVMEEMVKKGENVVIAHLKHLKEHNEAGYLKEGKQYLWDNKEVLTFDPKEVMKAVHNHLPGHNPLEKTEPEEIQMALPHTAHGGGCPGSLAYAFQPDQSETITDTKGDTRSQLTHWPVQMHLINPNAPHFQGSDLLLSADCVAYAMGDFHASFLKGKTLVIACPKLDSNMEIYVEKLKALVEHAKINTLTVMKMEVPCCGGILQLAQIATRDASRKVPIKSITISAQGEILAEDWV